MMDEIMRQEERILLNQIAKLTEEGHLAWDCVEYTLPHTQLLLPFRQVIP